MDREKLERKRDSYYVFSDYKIEFLALERKEVWRLR